MGGLECWRRVKPDIPEALATIDIIKKHGISLRWLRAPVTGPFTLASRVYIDSGVGKGLMATCIARKELVLDIFSELVSNTIGYLSDLGYNVIFIDEPVFNYIIGKRILFNYSEDEIVGTIERIITPYISKVEFGIHVCGRLNPRIIELLLRVQGVKYISIELHDTPSNIDLISKEVLEKNEKYLAPGIVSSQKPVVESVDEAIGILKLVYEKVGDRIDMVSGDCGFGGLKGTLGNREKEYEVAISKLGVVVEAVNRLKSLLGK